MPVGLAGLATCWREQKTQMPTPQEIELRAQLARRDERILELEKQRDELLYALERIESTVPGQGDGGGFVFDHYDHEGEYIGSQNVDPTWVVFEMVGVATNAIAAVKGGA